LNLDTLVRIGQPPWQPTPAAYDVDVWDKYDFPLCGTFRLGDDLVIFDLITTAGSRSLWAYVPVPADDQAAVETASFDTEHEFCAFLEDCFSGRDAVFAAAEDFKISSKSDGIPISSGRHALLEAGTRWYVQRQAALTGFPVPAVILVEGADDAALLEAAQGALASAPA